MFGRMPPHGRSLRSSASVILESVRARVNPDEHDDVVGATASQLAVKVTTRLLELLSEIGTWTPADLDQLRIHIRTLVIEELARDAMPPTAVESTVERPDIEPADCASARHKGTHVHEHGQGRGVATHPDGVDAHLLNSLTNAAADRCDRCTTQILEQLADDDATWARLIEWACETHVDARGRLPRDMTEQGAPGSSGEAFRALARTFLYLGANRRYEEWAAMPVRERLAAARSALQYVTNRDDRGVRLGPDLRTGSSSST